MGPCCLMPFASVLSCVRECMNITHTHTYTHAHTSIHTRTHTHIRVPLVPSDCSRFCWRLNETAPALNSAAQVTVKATALPQPPQPPQPPKPPQPLACRSVYLRHLQHRPEIEGTLLCAHRRVCAYEGLSFHLFCVEGCVCSKCHSCAIPCAFFNCIRFMCQQNGAF